MFMLERIFKSNSSLDTTDTPAEESIRQWTS